MSDSVLPQNFLVMNCLSFFFGLLFLDTRDSASAAGLKFQMIHEGLCACIILLCVRVIFLMKRFQLVTQQRTLCGVFDPYQSDLHLQIGIAETSQRQSEKCFKRLAIVSMFAKRKRQKRKQNEHVNLYS